MDGLGDIGSKIGGMFGGGAPGGSNPLPAAPVDPGDAGPWAMTGGGTSPAPTPVESTGAVRGGFLPKDQGPFNPFSLIGPAAAGIGSIIGLAKGKGGSTDKAIKQLGQSTQPLQNVSNQQLQAYSSGQLTPTQQASVDRFKQEQRAKWQQYLASAGIPQSSAMADIEAKISTDAQVYADKLLQQDFNNAYAGIGLSSGNLANVARMQALQDEQQRQEWAAFMKSLGQLGTDVGPIKN